MLRLRLMKLWQGGGVEGDKKIRSEFFLIEEIG